jgi:hypothetical protein
MMQRPPVVCAGAGDETAHEQSPVVCAGAGRAIAGGVRGCRRALAVIGVRLRSVIANTRIVR